MSIRRTPGNPGRFIRPLLLAGLLGLAGCAYALVSGGRINQAQAGRIERHVQEVRALSFKKRVPMVVKTPDEVGRMVVEDLARDYTDEELEAGGQAGSMLGLYPPGMDLKAETVKLLKSQVAGFYDTREKQMVLVEGAYAPGFKDRALEFLTGRDLVGEMLLAHELTHALEDQNFDLGNRLEKLRDNSDESLALGSVAEGDATLAGFATVAGRMDSATADALAAQLDNLPAAFAAEAKDVPEGLGTPLIFQYSEGVRFVAEAYHHGGWNGVDALFRKPPRSTQQIIDPALYFDHPAPPLDVTVAGYGPILSGWKKVDEDTYGELLLQIILERGLGKNAPETALARRWAGDRMAVLKRASAVTVVWMIVFRDADAAARFGAVYRGLLDRGLARTPHHVETKSAAVLVVVGNGAARSEKLAPAVWRESTVLRPSPSARAPLEPMGRGTQAAADRQPPAAPALPPFHCATLPLPHIGQAEPEVEHRAKGRPCAVGRRAYEARVAS